MLILMELFRVSHNLEASCSYGHSLKLGMTNIRSRKRLLLITIIELIIILKYVEALKIVYIEIGK
jgi:hypothetical protein